MKTLDMHWQKAINFLFGQDNFKLEKLNYHFVPYRAGATSDKGLYRK